MRAMASARAAARWAVTHAVVKVLNRREARRGSPFARLLGDERLRVDPYPIYEQVRARGPLSGHRFIRVSATHAVVSEVLRSDDFGVSAADQLPEPIHTVVRVCTGEYDVGPVDPPSLLALDAPDHTRLRRLVARAFTARRVAAMTEGIERRTRALLDGLQGRDRFDLVDDFAVVLPVAVIADLMGVPQEHREPLVQWGNEAAKQLDQSLGFIEFYRTTRAITGLHHWVDQHLDHLRAHPGDDLLSGVLASIESLEPTERPTRVELRMVALLLLVAGFETTVNLIGNAVALFETHPDQRRRCQQDPSLWTGAVEEVLRFDPPVQFTARTAHRTTELAGQRVGPGETVLLLLGGANRDPAVFEDPHRFDVTRPDAGEHLSFSLGAHFCIGAQLARLEAAVALRELYARFPDLRVDGEPVRRTTRVLRGYEHLPVRVR